MYNYNNNVYAYIPSFRRTYRVCSNNINNITAPIQLVQNGVNAPFPSYGRLEYCYENAWGGVCAVEPEGFTPQDVDVACYQLGLAGKTTSNSSWTTCSKVKKACDKEMESPG